MSSGLQEKRDFIKGIFADGETARDWHGMTQAVKQIDKDSFPGLTPEFVSYPGKDGVMIRSPWQVLLADDDGLPVGEPFNPDSFGYVTPQKGFETVMEALAGTRFSVERCGMLFNRSIWFVSVRLDELKELEPSGFHFNLGFAGGLDRSEGFSAQLSSTRIVCNNTLRIAQREGDNIFSVRQTKNSALRLPDAKAEVERCAGMAKIFSTAMAKIAEKPATVDVARAAFAGEIARNIVKSPVFRGDGVKDAFISKSQNKDGSPRSSRALGQVDDLVTLFKSGDGNKGETRADILNGFTQLFTRGGMDDSKKDRWLAIQSSEFGVAANRKEAFFYELSEEKRFKALVKDGQTALAAVE